MIFLALFPLVSQTIPTGPFSYTGQSSKREEIIVDPQNCPLLNRAYDTFVARLPTGEKEILQSLVEFIRNELFDLKHCCRQEVDRLVHTQPATAIPLDIFLENKTGVCRHIALTATLLLDRLVQEGHLKGTVLFIREDLPHTRHAWTLFLSHESAWHLDAYWNILEDAQNPTSLEHLIAIYGYEAIFNAWQQSQQHWPLDGTLGPH